MSSWQSCISINQCWSVYFAETFYENLSISIVVDKCLTVWDWEGISNTKAFVPFEYIPCLNQLIFQVTVGVCGKNI